MNRAIDATGIKPVVDEKVFSLDKLKEAYQYMVKSLKLELKLFDACLPCYSGTRSIFGSLRLRSIRYGALLGPLIHLSCLPHPLFSARCGYEHDP